MTHITAVCLGLAGPDEIRARSSGEVTRPATFDPDTGEPVVGGLFCPRIFGTPALLREYGPGANPSACEANDHDWTRDATTDPPSGMCERCRLRLTAIGSADAQREQFGHVELAAPVPHAWLQGAPSRDATLLRALPVLPAGLRPPAWESHDDWHDDLTNSPSGFDLNEHYRRVIVANVACADLLTAGAPEAERQAAERRLAETVVDLFGAIEARFTNEDGRLRAAHRGVALDEPAPLDAPIATAVPDRALGLDRCGLPRSLALRLFAPLVAGRMVEAGEAADLVTAARAVERATPGAFGALEQVVGDAVVVLSRPPTRRRRHVLAFEPALIDGEAIRLHPLAALALGVDAAHDRVTVRAPLAPAAQREARARLHPSRNLLAPSSGQLAFEPGADVVLGCYYLTTERPGARGEDRRFGSWADAIRAYGLRTTLPEAGVDLQARISVRMYRDPEGDLWEYDPAVDRIDPHDPSAIQPDQLEMVPTTVGRLILFKTIDDVLRDLGADPLPFENTPIDQNGLKALVTTLIRRYRNRHVAAALGAIAKVGLGSATLSGVSIAHVDIQAPPSKPALLAEADAEVADIESQFRRNLITNEERYHEVIAIWTRTRDAVTTALVKALDPFGPIAMMARSGAGSTIEQTARVMGTLGFQSHPWGFLQEAPIRSGWAAGVSAHEYAMHAAHTRKASTSRVLQERHADALWRRLVAAIGDVIIAEEDCGTEEGVWIGDLTRRVFQHREWVTEPRRERLDLLVGRYLAREIVDPSTGLILIDPSDHDQALTEDDLARIASAVVPRVSVRSPATCESRHGVCQRCYGWDRSRRTPAEVGSPVGMIAAQAIAADAATVFGHIVRFGLNMPIDRLPLRRRERLQVGFDWLDWLLEARRPLNPAILSDIDGVVQVDTRDDGRWITVTSREVYHDEHDLAPGYHPLVKVGDRVEMRQNLAEADGMPPIMARLDGTVKRVDERIVVVYEEVEEREYRVSWMTPTYMIDSGQMVAAGDMLGYGQKDPRDVLRIQGREGVTDYIVGELDDLFTGSGLGVDRRHFELVVRQMLKFLRVDQSGDTNFTSGQFVYPFDFEDENRRVLRAGEEPGATFPELATAQPALLGLSALARQADGFLASAAFGPARRSLAAAALARTIDRLHQPAARLTVGALALTPVGAPADTPGMSTDGGDELSVPLFSAPLDDDPDAPLGLANLDLGDDLDAPFSLADLDLGDIDDLDLSLDYDPPRQG